MLSVILLSNCPNHQSEFSKANQISFVLVESNEFVCSPSFVHRGYFSDVMIIVIWIGVFLISFSPYDTIVAVDNIDCKYVSAGNSVWAMVGSMLTALTS